MDITSLLKKGSTSWCSATFSMFLTLGLALSSITILSSQDCVPTAAGTVSEIPDQNGKYNITGADFGNATPYMCTGCDEMDASACLKVNLTQFTASECMLATANAGWSIYTTPINCEAINNNMDITSYIQGNNNDGYFVTVCKNGNSGAAVMVIGSCCEEEAGSISTTSNTTVCVGDGLDDIIDIVITGENGTNTSLIITDDQGVILGLVTGNSINFDGAGTGTCLIYHLAFDDEVPGLEIGSNINDVSGCYDVSDPITVTKISGYDCVGQHPIPTMSQWALFILGLIFLNVGIVYIRNLRLA